MGGPPPSSDRLKWQRIKANQKNRDDDSSKEQTTKTTSDSTVLNIILTKTKADSLEETRV